MRAKSDLRASLVDRDGQTRPYAEIAASAGDRFAGDLAEGVWDERYARVQASLDRLARDIDAARLDVLAIVGDDQDEVFDQSMNPALAVYHGDAVNVHAHDNSSVPERHRALAAQIAAAQGADRRRDYIGAGVLGRSVAAQLTAAGFDVTSCLRVADGRGFGHAFSFPAHRLLGDRPVRLLPVMVNTYYPPNQPTPARCWELGGALARAIDGLPGDVRVGALASGGLTHFVVDPDLDEKVLDAMRAKDGHTLGTIDPDLLQSGTSEIRNWIVVAGMLGAMECQWLEYVRGIRTPAGTGCGLAFGSWA